MQVIDQILKCRIEKFCCQNHTAIEQYHCPPDHGWLQVYQYNHHAQCCEALQAKARFHAKSSLNTLQSENHTFIKRLVFHQKPVALAAQ